MVEIQLISSNFLYNKKQPHLINSQKVDSKARLFAKEEEQQSGQKALVTTSAFQIASFATTRCRWREIVRMLHTHIVPLSQNIDSLKAFFLSASSHARLACSVVNALATAHSRYQLSRRRVRLPSNNKKTTSSLTRRSCFLVPMAGDNRYAFCLLVHPNADAFRYRTSHQLTKNDYQSFS